MNQTTVNRGDFDIVSDECAFRMQPLGIIAISLVVNMLFLILMPPQDDDDDGKDVLDTARAPHRRSKRMRVGFLVCLKIMYAIFLCVRALGSILAINLAVYRMYNELRERHLEANTAARHFFICSSLLEMQSSSLASVAQLIQAAFYLLDTVAGLASFSYVVSPGNHTDSPREKYLKKMTRSPLFVVPTALFCVAPTLQTLVVLVGAISFGLPFTLWLVFGLLILVFGVAWLHMFCYEDSDDDSIDSEDMGMCCCLGLVPPNFAAAGYQSLLIVVPFVASAAAVMGGSYFGWLVNETSYADAITLLARSRPAVADWTVREIADLTNII